MSDDFGGVVVLGADLLSASLFKAGELAEAGTKAAVSAAANMGLTTIRGNASGRPGPNAPTGNYRRSWNRSTRSSRGGYSVALGTSAPQARRLEFGFSGTDSLGRTYHQPPLPHVAPAVPVIERFFISEMSKVRDMVAAGGSLRIGEG